MKKNWIHEDVQSYFTQMRDKRLAFRRRYAYFHGDVIAFLQRMVPPKSRVLIVGCDTQDIAKQLTGREIYILEFDASPARDAVPAHVTIVQDLEDTLRQGELDYVVLPHTLQFLEDIQSFLEAIQQGIQAHTRLIILEYNFFWAPFLKIAEKLGLKTPFHELNWLSSNDVRNLLVLTRYQQVTSGARCLIPIYIPVVSNAVNRLLSNLPLFRWACQRTFTIARPLNKVQAGRSLKTSVIVPARNEAGNIANLLDQLPVLGSSCEVIFVEGHSKDETWKEIQRQIQSHPRREKFQLQAFQQTGQGKADATRLGFSKATGDVLLILDADLSVQPADLVHFYDALAGGTAEFLNGSRLVYEMEKHAMQILNLFFNKVFGIFVSWLVGQPVKDTLCGTKVLYRRDYERIHDAFLPLASLDPFGDFELLFGASTLGLKICDVPVRYKERTYGSTNIRRFRNGWELLRVCLTWWGQLR